MRIDRRGGTLSVVTAGLVAATLMAASANADPGPTTAGPPVVTDPGQPAPAPQDVAAVATAASPDTNPDATPPDGVPHLSSPQNLPPGTTDTPPGAGQPRTLGYLRDLLHAVRTQEVSGADMLLLLAQRPLDPDAAPPPGMSAGPQPPPASAPVP